MISESVLFVSSTLDCSKAIKEQLEQLEQARLYFHTLSQTEQQSVALEMKPPEVTRIRQPAVLWTCQKQKPVRLEQNSDVKYYCQLVFTVPMKVLIKSENVLVDVKHKTKRRRENAEL